MILTQKSAVHVVDSPPQLRDSGSGRNEPNLINPRIRRGDSSRRLRGGTSSNPPNREQQVRHRVARMENLLSQFNASLTALEQRTSPEESRQV